MIARWVIIALLNRFHVLSVWSNCCPAMRPFFHIATVVLVHFWHQTTYMHYGGPWHWCGRGTGKGGNTCNCDRLRPQTLRWISCLFNINDSVTLQSFAHLHQLAYKNKRCFQDPADAKRMLRRHLPVFSCAFLFVSSFCVFLICVLKGVFVVVYRVWYVLCCCLQGVIKHDDDDDRPIACALIG